MMVYMGWEDHDKKRTTQQKIDHAIARYWKKFDRAPKEVLVNAVDAVEWDDVLIRVVHHVKPNTFQVGDADE
jgi:hypothetical protein